MFIFNAVSKTRETWKITKDLRQHDLRWDCKDEWKNEKKAIKENGQKIKMIYVLLAF
jgi:hypothetical protein